MSTKPKRADPIKELREHVQKIYKHADEVVKRINDSGVTPVPSQNTSAAIQ